MIEQILRAQIEAYVKELARATHRAVAAEAELGILRAQVAEQHSAEHPTDTMDSASTEG